jgi:hypothetical protein
MVNHLDLKDLLYDCLGFALKSCYGELECFGGELARVTLLELL